MLLDQQKSALQQIVLYSAARATGMASKARLSLPPLGVDALGDAGFTRAFSDDARLPFRKERPVGCQSIGNNRLVAPVLGHIRPAQRQRVVVARANGKARRKRACTRTCLNFLDVAVQFMQA